MEAERQQNMMNANKSINKEQIGDVAEARVLIYKSDCLLPSCGQRENCTATDLSAFGFSYYNM